jgi:hypothetical protein
MHCLSHIAFCGFIDEVYNPRRLHSALSEQIFNIAKAEGKPEIQPDGVLDDGTRETVTGIGDLLHLRQLPHQPG